jgi:hypothetical protein
LYFLGDLEAGVESVVCACNRPIINNATIIIELVYNYGKWEGSAGIIDGSTFSIFGRGGPGKQGVSVSSGIFERIYRAFSFCSILVSF